jgi:hypothetical protein
MQLRRAANHAALHVGDDDGAIVGALGGIALDKTVIEETVEAIMAALRIEPQQVIAQQRQFLLLAQGPNVAKARSRAVGIIVCHVKLLSETLEEASNP